MNKAPFNTSFPIVDTNGFPTQAFRDYLFKLGFLVPITGTGSPEGVIEAPQYSIYLDTTAAAGSIQYRKMLTSISGDTTQGWKLV